jgi:hypothetical protein
MAYQKASGVIEVLARNGKGFKIGEDWFSVFKAQELSGAQKGDEVSFEYVTVEKGGASFNNVKGNVTIKNKGAGEEQGQQSAARTSGGTTRRSGGDGGDGAVGYDGDQFRKRSMKHFPVPKTDVDRPIIRQNSLTQANALFATLAKEGFYGQVDQVFNSANEAAAEVIELASLFEAYSSGETN